MSAAIRAFSPPLRLRLSGPLARIGPGRLAALLEGGPDLAASLLEHPPAGVLLAPVADGGAPVRRVLALLAVPEGSGRVREVSISLGGGGVERVRPVSERPDDLSSWPSLAEAGVASALLGLLLRGGRDAADPAVPAVLAQVRPTRPSRLQRLGDSVLYLELDGTWAGCEAYTADGSGVVRTAHAEARPIGEAGERGFLFVYEAGLRDARRLVLLGAAGRLAVIDIAAAPPTSLNAHLDATRGLEAAVLLRQREALGSLLRGARRLDGREGDMLLAMQHGHRLAPRRLGPEGAPRASLDLLVPCGDGVFLSGRLSADLRAAAVRIMAPTGEAAGLDPVFGPADADGSRLFSAFLPLEGAARCAQVRAQVVQPGGLVHDLLSPVFVGTALQRRRAVLGALPASAYRPEMLARSLHPALGRLQRAVVAETGVAAETAFGTPPTAPAISLVVPLYREYGFVRSQLHALARDPDRAEVELVYVLDRPEDRDDVDRLLRGLAALYRLPLRLLVMGTNGGYAAATNRGAAAARGGTLVLMNSDVVPAAHGWLGRWRRRHAAAAAAGAGISGPRLLYADGSLQHAGLFFESGLMPWWTSNHYFKGYPGDYPPALVRREVPAVTGACLMIARSLFEAVGGLSESYVVGDFEDSDLCLKVRRTGADCRYVPDEVLYHFERTSIRHNDDYAGTPAVRYNGWLHGETWGGAIAALMDRFGRPA